MLLCLAGNRQFFCCGGKILLRSEKKVPVICLAGCAVSQVAVSATTAVYNGLEILSALASNTGLRLIDK